MKTPPGSLVPGAPAKIVRKLAKKERGSLRLSIGLDATGFVIRHGSFNPNSEVADDGRAYEVAPECARPRAQQLGYLQAVEYFPITCPSQVAAAGTAALR